MPTIRTTAAAPSDHTRVLIAIAVEILTSGSSKRKNSTGRIRCLEIATTVHVVMVTVVA